MLVTVQNRSETIQNQNATIRMLIMNINLGTGVPTQPCITAPSDLARGVGVDDPAYRNGYS
jgi:hypothetical protein